MYSSWFIVDPTPISILDILEITELKHKIICLSLTQKYFVLTCLSIDLNQALFFCPFFLSINKETRAIYFRVTRKKFLKMYIVYLHMEENSLVENNSKNVVNWYVMLISPKRHTQLYYRRQSMALFWLSICLM